MNMQKFLKAQQRLEDNGFVFAYASGIAYHVYKDDAGAVAYLYMSGVVKYEFAVA